MEFNLPSRDIGSRQDERERERERETFALTDIVSPSQDTKNLDQVSMPGKENEKLIVTANYLIGGISGQESRRAAVTTLETFVKVTPAKGSGRES